MTDTGEDLWITVSEFRSHMSRILREVELGSTFTVVRAGRVVARLAPHAIDKPDLDALIEDEQLPLPPEWQTTITGEPMPNVVRAIRLSRAGH